MAITYINTGSGANAGDGDSLRAAFIKINNNFSYLSTASFGGDGGPGGVGAVRIIYPGTTRSFPSTNTGDL